MILFSFYHLNVTSFWFREKILRFDYSRRLNNGSYINIYGLSKSKLIQNNAEVIQEPYHK